MFLILPILQVTRLTKFPVNALNNHRALSPATVHRLPYDLTANFAVLRVNATKLAQIRIAPGYLDLRWQFYRYSGAVNTVKRIRMHAAGWVVLERVFACLRDSVGSRKSRFARNTIDNYRCTIRVRHRSTGLWTSVVFNETVVFRVDYQSVDTHFYQ